MSITINAIQKTDCVMYDKRGTHGLTKEHSKAISQLTAEILQLFMYSFQKDEIIRFDAIESFFTGKMTKGKSLYFFKSH